jgi:hypothetical protein
MPCLHICSWAITKRTDGPATQDEFINDVIKGVPNILATLQAFDAIASANGNSRSVVNGYNASAEYVKSRLIAAGYSPVDMPLEV